LPNKVNTLLVSRLRNGPPGSVADLEAMIRTRASIEDLGLRLRALPNQPMLSLESDGSLIDDPRGRAATRAGDALGLSATPIFTYLANSIKSGDREVPYSLVTALDLGTVGTTTAAGAEDRPIVINDWTARELGVHVGDPVSLDFYVWEDPGRLVTRTAS